MFIHRQRIGLAQSKKRVNLKVDKKYKKELVDPNLGLDYVSPLIHVKPQVQERFQSQQFVQELLRSCNGNRTKTQSADIQDKFTQSPPKRLKILSQKDIDLKRKMPNRFKTHQSVVTNKIQHCHFESCFYQSQKQDENDNIFLNSAFLRNKQFKRLNMKFQVKQTLMNPFDKKDFHNKVKTATISSRHKFKPTKAYFNNEVAFVKRNSDCVKMNPQNINDFVSEVIELYGNNLKRRVATESNSRQSPMNIHNSYFQQQPKRLFRNKKQSSSVQNNRWSRNSHSINRHCLSQNGSQLTTKSFYSGRPKTQQKARRTIT